MNTANQDALRADHASPSKFVLEHELTEIRLLLQENAGVLIDQPVHILAASVTQCLASSGYSSAAELLANMRRSPRECEFLLEALVHGDTGFFRPAKLFEILQNEVLPDIARRNNGQTLRPLRVWSAGCSTGEEAYSIAMCACEAFAGNHNSWNVHIVAGDIRRDALKVAERGLYPASALVQLPSRLAASYCSRVGDHLMVKPRLRNLVTFTHMNLTEPAFIGRFHCIFCLDVLPHLSVSARAVVWHRLQLALEPGGYLFLGEHDQVPAALSFLRHTASVYQRPFAAAAGAAR